MISSNPLKTFVSPTRLSDYKDFDDHEFLVAITDTASGLKAYVSVHSTKRGPAHGGTRMMVYRQESDAIKDALRLSKAMSYKSALAGLPYGGAKGVIVLENDNVDREKILKAYAEKIEKLNGLFMTGTDVGLTDSDTKLMAKYSKYILGISGNDKKGYSTSKCAALGVYHAIRASAKHKYGSSELRGRKVGVKGLGKLGFELVSLLVADGVEVIAADIDQAMVEAVLLHYPSVKIVPSSEIHKQPMDIYSPCALGNEFSSRTIAELHCEIIAGGANNQLVSVKLGEKLHKRGILFIPDYIANAGGLIFVSDELEADGFHVERVLERVVNIENTVEMILKRSEVLGISPEAVADHIGEERLGS